MACDVLLINPPYRLVPPFETPGIIDPPHNLLVIGAALREHGLNVALLDMPVLGLNFTDLRSRLDRLAPRVVGIGNHSTYSFPIVKRTAREVKRWRPGAPVIAGGIYVSLCPEETLRRSRDIDAVVIGEGDITAPRLVDALLNGGSPEGLAGVAMRDDSGTPVANLPAPHPEDLDALPLPAADLLPADHYVGAGRRYILSRTRGCPRSCSYCTSAYVKRDIRFRSPVAVVEEMAAAYSLGFRDFFFYDNMFTLNPGQVRELCRLVVEAHWDIKWICMTSVDKVDKDLLTLMRRAGCTQIGYGVETISEDALRQAGRAQEAADTAAAVKLTQECGMEAVVYIMLGMPGVTLADEFRTLQFLRRLRPNEVGAFVFKPFPGTVYHAEPEVHGVNIEKEGLTHWATLDEPCHSTRHLSRSDIIEAMLVCNHLFRDGGVIPAGPRYRRRPGVVCVCTGEGGILYNPFLPLQLRTTDMYLNGYRIDPQYFEVLYRCDGHHSLEDIAGVVGKLFDLSGEQARAKVEEVVAAARELNLLEEMPDIAGGDDEPLFAVTD